jgi:proteasome inhibitor subunit 1 (PI31)
MAEPSASDPLNIGSLLSSLPNLLPRGTTSPLPKPTDVIAALVHTIHIALDFRIIPNPISAVSQASTSQGEETEIDDTVSETPTAVEQEDEQLAVEGRLPEGWNSRGEDSYVFEYRHVQSSMVFRIRVGRMGGRVQLDGMAEVCLMLISLCM